MIPKAYFLPEYYLLPVLNKRQLYRFETTTTDLLNKKRVFEKTLIREVRLTYFGKKKELFVFEVFTSKVVVLLNEIKQSDKLLEEDIYAFDEIDLGVNDKGEIVKIYNLKEMQHRWERKMIELREDYSGYEFDVFANDISNVLRDEEKILFFLNSKNMFGLYFHGLFGKNDINGVPKKRTATILEFDDVAITEEIWTDNRAPKFIIAAQKSDDEHKNIISNNDVIKIYEGELTYNKENQLQEGFLEIENENKNIKHNVLLWGG